MHVTCTDWNYIHLYINKLTTSASTNDVKWLGVELRKYTNFFMQFCPKHRMQHLAFAFDKTESDDPRFVKVNGLSLAKQDPDLTASAFTKR